MVIIVAGKLTYECLELLSQGLSYWISRWWPARKLLFYWSATSRRKETWSCSSSVPPYPSDVFWEASWWSKVMQKRPPRWVVRLTSGSFFNFIHVQQRCFCSWDGNKTNNVTTLRMKRLQLPQAQAHAGLKGLIAISIETCQVWQSLLHRHSKFMETMETMNIHVLECIRARFDEPKSKNIGETSKIFYRNTYKSMALHIEMSQSWNSLENSGLPMRWEDLENPWILTVEHLSNLNLRPTKIHPCIEGKLSVWWRSYNSLLAQIIRWIWRWTIGRSFCASWSGESVES